MRRDLRLLVTLVLFSVSIVAAEAGPKNAATSSRISPALNKPRPRRKARLSSSDRIAPHTHANPLAV